MKLPLVEYDCGCIGFAPNEGEIILVQGTDGEIGLGVDCTLAHAGGGYVPAKPERIERIADEMALLLAWGNRFRELRTALGIEGQR
jgi:hypothetical protein